MKCIIKRSDSPGVVVVEGAGEREATTEYVEEREQVTNSERCQCSYTNMKDICITKTQHIYIIYLKVKERSVFQGPGQEN